MRLLRDVGGTLRLTQALGGAPTVTATRDSDGTTFSGAASGTSPEWTKAVTPAQAPEVDLLSVEWAYGGATYRTQAEVVGGFICSVDEIRNALPPNNTSTDTEVENARDWAEDLLERACRVAFRPRYAREKLDGSGHGSLFLQHPRVSSVLSASVNDEALTLDDIDVDPIGVFHSDTAWGVGTRNVSVTYVHGYDAPPEPVRAACIRLARYHLLEDPSNAFERATSYTTEDATYSLVTPGVRGAATPIPEVNAVIDEYRYVLSA